MRVGGDRQLGLALVAAAVLFAGLQEPARAAEGAAEASGAPVIACGDGWAVYDGPASVHFSDRSVAMALTNRDGAAWGVHWSVVGAAPTRPRARGERSARVHVLVGPRDTWRTGLRTYSEIAYDGVCPGVNLTFETRQRAVKYTVTVPAGFDASQLRFRYDGAQELRVADSGAALEVVTGLGVLRETGLLCWQPTPDGARRALAARYAGVLGVEYGIEFAGVDPSLPITIDPEISWSTFFGGRVDFNDAAYTVAADSRGFVYMAGTTQYGLAYPPQGGFDTTLNSSDAYIASFNRAGALVWWSYLGGTRGELPTAMAVNGAGEIYITGRTTSTDFPLINAFDTTFAGLAGEGFVAKVSAAGDQLVWSSFIGGSGRDEPYGIAVDANGSAVVAGSTFSNDFPLLNAFDSTFGGGYLQYIGTFGDGFVAKIDSSGALAWSSYIGCDPYNWPGYDYARAVAVDAAGDVYVTGVTEVGGWAGLRRLTTGQDYPGDAYVAKVSASGALQWASSFGTWGADIGYAIAVDRYGTIYVGGYTEGDAFPVIGGFDTTSLGPWGATTEGFVVKLAPGGVAIAWSSYFGGNGEEEIRSLAVDEAGNMYVAGWTSSDDLPMVDAVDSTMDTNWYLEGFAARIKAAGDGVDWSTYLGGSYEDYAYGLALDGLGNVLVTGTTASDDFPVLNAFDPTIDGGYYLYLGSLTDAFLVKLSNAAVPNAPPLPPDNGDNENGNLGFNDWCGAGVLSTGAPLWGLAGFVLLALFATRR